MTFSFRTRLFVIAGLIVGAVLAAVLVLGWTRVMAFEMARLETRLCMEARRVATQRFGSQDMTRLQTDVMLKLHLSESDQVMLRFEGSMDAVGFQSSNWQMGPAFDSAPWQPSKTDMRSDALQERAEPRDRPPKRHDDAGPPRGEPPAHRGPVPMSGGCALASFTSQDSQARQWRAARFTTEAGSGVVAGDLGATKAEVKAALKQALKLVIPLAVVLTGLGAWLLSALTMRPVNRLRDAMTDVNQRALDRRLSSQGEDREFKVLIDAYNTMLARLQASFQQASRFSADAAHELKTPLTILQGRIEQALTQAEQPEIQAELSELLDEVGRLSTITRKLLLLSQADAGWLALQRQTIDMSAMLDEIVGDAHMLLTQQSLSSEIDRQLTLTGDSVLLRQLLNNLISNAVRYCQPGAWIEVTANQLPGRIQVIFSNATHPIAQEDRTRFFDRFYRVDAAHNRRIDGHGLGLSLAREIARAHGGDLLLLETTLERVTLQLTLPLAQ